MVVNIHTPLEKEIVTTMACTRFQKSVLDFSVKENYHTAGEQSDFITHRNSTYLDGTTR